MKRVAIVSPYFPPSNLAGVHRARHLSKFLPANSWEPVVICVHERYHEQAPDRELSRLVPESVEIVKTAAIPASVTRPVGIGDMGLRAYWHLKKAVSSVLANGGVDLLFVTMSPYYNALAGPELKKRFNVPLVVDFQDPWISRWGATLPKFSKGGISHLLATRLESRIIRHADHVTSVSEGANDETRARYPELPADALSALPIGGDAQDYDFLRHSAFAAQTSQKPENEFHFSYVGTLLPRGYPALRAVLMALRQVKQSQPALYRRLRFNFVGTSAQSNAESDFRVIPHASEFGVSECVVEVPQRLNYMQALKALVDADAVLVMGSDEPHYTASKLQPGLLAGRPLLAVFHESSSACGMVRRAGGADLVTFTENDDPSEIARRVVGGILKIIRRPDSLPRVNARELTPMSAESVTRQFADLFNRVVEVGCRRPWW